MQPIDPFTLRLPAHVHFGRGALAGAVPRIASFGRRLLVVHGANASRSESLRRGLAADGRSVIALPCAGEPTLQMLTQALDRARDARPDAVVAIGGGAVLDLGKALAALVPASTAPLDHLEVVGDGRPLPAPPLPLIAIPTTAGTGSEATRNAVIGVPERAVKVSLRDDRMVPVLAVIDPALTDGTPGPQTLASGLDAVTQVIEPYLSVRATPFTDALARPAIGMGLTALVALMERGEDAGARDALAYVAHVSGIALAHAGLGAVHGLAGVLGGETGAPHGAICARLLPHVLGALRGHADLSDAGRHRLDAVIATMDASVPGGLAGLSAWLDGHGLAAESTPLDVRARDRVCAAAQRASSIKASPVGFSQDELSALLEGAGW